MSSAKKYDGGSTPGKMDPTGTVTVRRRYGQRLRGRWNALKGAIWDGIAEDDVLGLREQRALGSGDFTARLADDYQDFTDYEEPEDIRDILAQTRQSKVRAFMDWLNRQLKRGVLEVIHRGENPYIRASYEAGVQLTLDAFAEQTAMEQKKAQIPPPDIPQDGLSLNIDFTGAAEEVSPDVSVQGILGPRFGVDMRTLIRLYARNFEYLKNITEDTADAIREELVEGYINGENPRKIARSMNDRIDAIGKRRSTVLARTETINAATEGTLTRFEQFGGEKVTMVSEWLATDDDRTCPICHSLDGRAFTTDFIRNGSFHFEPSDGEPDSLEGTYPVRPPLHPQCRCALAPKPPNVWDIPPSKTNVLPSDGPVPNIQRKAAYA